MKYLICRNGNRIRVKRSDRCYEFGVVVAEADSLQQAQWLAAQARTTTRNATRDLFVNGIDTACRLAGGHDA